ncbi:MAG TPA: DUF389 domain-containing protein [Polyangiaceae bacterium]|nr:DUF389 domain-containing protein [Polyangiaceae bacterium]
MLRRDASEATSYWLQLVVSIGIATLGLVVGSTAVVIGAMLVAPLMGPIIGLAMGLATGSPFLVLRSAGRIGLSVLVAIGGSALITILLPFHELNSEISARTSPTVLDLVTACFCALAGVYASLRPGSDTATTAAGTSISISLVPPLCASGYGIGIAGWHVAGGAALLFLTNLVAIVVVGTGAFVASGFKHVDVIALEREELEKGKDAPIARALARRLASLFESRGGPVLRLFMPLALLAAVYVPLGRALDEVAWEVRVRAAVRASIAGVSNRVVETRARVEHHEVDVVLVLLGKGAEAVEVRSRMDAEIRKVAGVAPRIEVVAVPDASAFAGLESSLMTPRPAALTPLGPSPDEQLNAVRARIRAALEPLWPTAVAGRPLVIDLRTDGGPLTVRVAHIGLALGRDALEAVARAAGAAVERPTTIIDVAIPERVERGEDDLDFIARLSSALQAAGSISQVNVCVSRPLVQGSARKLSNADAKLARAVDGLLADQARVTVTGGDFWKVRFSEESCSPAAAAPSAAPSSSGSPAPATPMPAASSSN